MFRWGAILTGLVGWDVPFPGPGVANLAATASQAIAELAEAAEAAVAGAEAALDVSQVAMAVGPVYAAAARCSVAALAAVSSLPQGMVTSLLAQATWLQVGECHDVPRQPQ